jgi:hemerythrin
MSFTRSKDALESVRPVRLGHDAIDDAIDSATEAADHDLVAGLEAVGDAMIEDFALEERLLNRLRFPLWDTHTIDHSAGMALISEAIAAARTGRFETARRLGIVSLRVWTGEHRKRHDASFLEWMAHLHAANLNVDSLADDPRLAAE